MLSTALMKTARQFIQSMIGRILPAAVALLLVTGASGQKTPAGESTNRIAREEAKQRRAKLPLAKGTLQAHDFLRRTLKLKTEDGLRTFTYTDNTYIFRDKEKITPDKLAVGETIALRFYTDKNEQILIRRIKAYGAAHPVGTGPTGATESAK